MRDLLDRWWLWRWMRKRGTDEHRGVADHDALAAKIAHVPG